jgi:hypothetical protein
MSFVEKPRDLRELLLFRTVKDYPDLGEPVPWKGATRPEFIELERLGFSKYKQTLPCDSGKVVIHYWWNGDSAQAPLYLKVKISPIDNGVRPA